MDITIIPDIHADGVRLKKSLDRSMGSEFWFLGDLIDGGSDDDIVLATVKKLVDSGKAQCVLGNHELNAILYHRFDRSGQPLRNHSEKNSKQHKTFIDKFGVGSSKALYWTDWFLELPLWIEKKNLRIIHACWDVSSIEIIKEYYPDGFIKKVDLEEIAAKQTPLGKAIDLIVSGPELRLPDGFHFSDIKGERRSEVRISWWKDGPYHWRKHALSVTDIGQLPDMFIEDSGEVSAYKDSDPPVFVGHYKLKGHHRLESKNALCLDYPENPCVYEWSGESILENRRIKTVG